MTPRAATARAIGHDARARRAVGAPAADPRRRSDQRSRRARGRDACRRDGADRVRASTCDTASTTPTSRPRVAGLAADSVADGCSACRAARRPRHDVARPASWSIGAPACGATRTGAGRAPADRRREPVAADRGWHGVATASAVVAPAVVRLGATPTPRRRPPRRTPRGAARSASATLRRRGTGHRCGSARRRALDDRERDRRADVAAPRARRSRPAVRPLGADVRRAAGQRMVARWPARSVAASAYRRCRPVAADRRRRALRSARRERAPRTRCAVVALGAAAARAPATRRYRRRQACASCRSLAGRSSRSS